MNMRIGATPAYLDNNQFSPLKATRGHGVVTDAGDIDVDNGRQAKSVEKPAAQGLEKLGEDLLRANSLQEIMSLLKRFLAGAGLLDDADGGGAAAPAAKSRARSGGHAASGDIDADAPDDVSAGAAAPTAGASANGADTHAPEGDIDADKIGGKTVAKATAAPEPQPASPAPAATTTDAPAATTAAAAAAAGKPAAAGDASASQGDISVNGGGKNTITVKNSSDREQNYALFTNPTAGMSSSFGRPDGFVTLKPGESANFKLPEQSSGYLQQMNDYTKADYDANKAPTADNFKATRAEYTFNADGSLYFNDSNIDGYNAALKMSANGETGGSDESILASVKKSNPDLIETVGDQQVVRGAQFFTDQTDTEARDALDLAINHNANPTDLNGNANTYVVPNDDKAVRGTKGNDLTLEFDDA